MKRKINEYLEEWAMELQVFIEDTSVDSIATVVANRAMGEATKDNMVSMSRTIKT